MSRKANYTDQALDNCIANFVDRESRKPTYSEIKKMCPLGVSNDRISSALRRAGDRAATNCSPIEQLLPKTKRPRWWFSGQLPRKSVRRSKHCGRRLGGLRPRTATFARHKNAFSLGALQKSPRLWRKCGRKLKGTSTLWHAHSLGPSSKTDRAHLERQWALANEEIGPSHRQDTPAPAMLLELRRASLAAVLIAGCSSTGKLFW